MPSDITYGSAVLLAKAYHEEDYEVFNFIAGSVDLGTLVGATLQLCYTLLHTAPKGSPKQSKSFDIREEAFDYFSDVLERNTAKVSNFGNLDEVDVITATTTLVMGTIVPLLEGDYEPYLSVDYEGIDERGFLILLASVSDAALETFQSYVPMLGAFERLSDNPSYEEAVNELLRLLPAIALQIHE